MNDFRSAVRQLRRRPGFTATAILTLALGIGANAAIFSVVDAVLLRPLPYADSGQLVRLWSAYPTRSQNRGTVSLPDLEDWSQQSRSLESIGGWSALRIGGLVLNRDGVPTELRTEYVTPGFFSTLGLPAEYGRFFSPSDHREGSNAVVVLSHGVWRRLFGGDRGVIGKPVSLSGQLFTVLGVMPQGFAYPSADAEAWVPLSLIPESGIPRKREVRFLSAIGRLAPGVDIQSARHELQLIAARLADSYPKANQDLTAISIEPLRDALVGPVRPAMWAILGAVAVVLLIGCVNVAGLILIRAESRNAELALRTALGASRAALVRHLAIESAVLAGLGGLIGLLLGVWGTRLLIALAPPGIPRLSEVHLSNRVVLFTALLSALVAVAVGLLPALRASRPDLRRAIGSGGRSGSSERSSVRLRVALVVTQVALVVVLSVGAGLLLRSYASVRSVDPGFDPDGVVTFTVSASGEDFQSFLNQALQRIRRLPGVRSAAMVRPLPLGPDTFSGERFEFKIPNETAAGSQDRPQANLRFISPGFFRTMKIPVLAGREFSDRDDADAPPVVLVSRSAARRYWRRESPVGSHILVGGSTVEVVGVVADFKQTRLEEDPEPAIYVPFSQTGRRGMSFVVRTQATAGIVKSVQQAIWSLRPEQPIQNIASMEQLVSDAVAGRRFSMTMLTAFALLALFLAALGIYGMVAYAVGQRVREIGIRIALGADPSSVLRLVIRRALQVTALGIGVGLAIAAATSGLLQKLLFRVGHLDPWAFFGAAVVLVLVAVFAAALPAVRAARVEPMEVLRNE